MPFDLERLKLPDQKLDGYVWAEKRSLADEQWSACLWGIVHQLCSDDLWDRPAGYAARQLELALNKLGVQDPEGK